MSQLRWTLLCIGVLFIAVLVWWELRRPRQARGGEHGGAREAPAESTPRPPREPTLSLPPMRAREPVIPNELPVVEVAEDAPSLPVLEAATPHAGPDDAGSPGDSALSAAAYEAPDEPQAEDVPTVVGVDALPRLAPAPLVDWPPDERRRVVALRLVAAPPERFAGRSLRQALAAEGFVLGRYAIFHKPDEDSRAVVSAASLSRPGTFDADTMDSQHYGGLSLFAVLPGPKSPPQAFDELVSAARNLNERLCGVLQDEQGSPLTPARIAALRERLAGGAAS
jgi:cell division protein ZipA